MTPASPDDLGIVYRKNRGQYLVHSQGREIPCSVSSLVRKELIYNTSDPATTRHVVREVREIKHIDPIAIGDEVRFVDAGDGTGMIVEVMPRQNALSRRAAVPGQGEHGQAIAANLDLVLAVFAAARPTPKWGLLDRCLVSAEAADLPAVICITKADLPHKQGDLERAIQRYAAAGYRTIVTSAATGVGLSELRAVLAMRRTALVGKSGVGKTTLLNALQPGLGLRVQAVSKIAKGRHTTTHHEMFPLDGGGAVVDTPGIRELALYDLEVEELQYLFPEIRPYAGTCRFRLDCRHDEEPGCKVRDAVLDGKISPQRYRSFLQLAEELR